MAVEIEDRLRELRKEARRINNEIATLFELQQAGVNSRFKGKCFKYRNHYSLPKEGEDWWLYVHVVGLIGGALVVNEFQTDHLGKVIFHPEKKHWGTMDDDYIEISEDEYKSAFSKMVKHIIGIGDNF